MNQSALVGGALLAGFVLFIAARDRLTVYGNVLFGAPAAASGAPTTANTGGVTVIAPGKPGAPSMGKLLDPFDWDLPTVPAIPDLGHLGF